MKKYSMKCSCGHVMSTEARDRGEAVEKIKSLMNQEALDAHWNELHPNDTNPKPTLEQSHAMIEQGVYEEVPAAVA